MLSITLTAVFGGLVFELLADWPRSARYLVTSTVAVLIAAASL